MFDRAKADKAAKDLPKNLAKAVTAAAKRRGQDKPKS